MSKSTKVKVIKNKKKFDWSIIKKFIAVLFRNDAVINVATTTKWYWSFLVFLFSLVVSVIPATVLASQQKGSQFVSGAYSDPYYYGLYEYANDDGTAKITFKHDGSGIDLNNTTSSVKYDDYTVNGDSTASVSTASVIKPTYSFERNGDYLFDIYVVKKNENFGDFNKIVTNILNSNTNWGMGSTAKRTEIEGLNAKYTRSTSFILFTDSGIIGRTYNGSTAASSFSGDYNHILEKFNFTGDYTLKDILNYNLDKTNVTTAQKGTLANFITFADQAYIDQRFNSTWVTFGIYCGINGGLLVIMGLVVFLLTRGKNNPNRSLNVLMCYSISNWASITPALLTLIIGFLMSNLVVMLFVVTFAFRIMRMGTKYLRPAYNK